MSLREAEVEALGRGAEERVASLGGLTGSRTRARREDGDGLDADRARRGVEAGDRRQDVREDDGAHGGRS